MSLHWTVASARPTLLDRLRGRRREVAGHGRGLPDGGRGVPPRLSSGPADGRGSGPAAALPAPFLAGLSPHGLASTGAAVSVGGSGGASFYGERRRGG